MQDISDEPHFREMAGKCRRLARQTDDPRAIESLTKLAEEYDKAADASAANRIVAPHANGKPFRRLK
jgi:hypothetical protein